MSAITSKFGNIYSHEWPSLHPRFQTPPSPHPHTRGCSMLCTSLVNYRKTATHGPVKVKYMQNIYVSNSLVFSLPIPYACENSRWRTNQVVKMPSLYSISFETILFMTMILPQPAVGLFSTDLKYKLKSRRMISFSSILFYLIDSQKILYLAEEFCSSSGNQICETDLLKSPFLTKPFEN